MHYPFDIPLGGSVRLPIHLVCEMLAYTLAYRYYLYLRTRRPDPISDENRVWIFVGAATGALFGSHLLGILERPAELSQLDLVQWMANKTVVGGFLGGLIGVESTKKIIGVRVSSGDLMTYPILLGLVIGRIGCHLAGLPDGTQGLPTTLPWAVDFGDGIPRHPVNLYEIVFLAALAFLIRNRERQGALPNGLRFKIFLIGYLIWRFFVEWLKPVYFFPFGLSTIQLAALAGLFYYRKTILSVFQPAAHHNGPREERF